MILAVAGCANNERAAPGADVAVVPDVTATRVADAVRAVQTAGLRVELEASATPVPLGACDDGTATAQDPAEGTELVRGSTVVVAVTGCPPR